MLYFFLHIFERYVGAFIREKSVLQFRIGAVSFFNPGGGVGPHAHFGVGADSGLIAHLGGGDGSGGADGIDCPLFVEFSLYELLDGAACLCEPVEDLALSVLGVAGAVGLRALEGGGHDG